MSIILKGIDMPKEDEVMVITVWGDDKEGTAFISNKEPYVTVPINAIQIPKNHGRLIDGDELNKSVHEWNPVYTYGRSAFTREIRNAPTILEAEERR